MPVTRAVAAALLLSLFAATPAVAEASGGNRPGWSRPRPRPAPQPAGIGLFALGLAGIAIGRRGFGRR